MITAKITLNVSRQRWERGSRYLCWLKHNDTREGNRSPAVTLHWNRCKSSVYEIYRNCSQNNYKYLSIYNESWWENGLIVRFILICWILLSYLSIDDCIMFTQEQWWQSICFESVEMIFQVHRQIYLNFILLIWQNKVTLRLQKKTGLNFCMNENKRLQICFCVRLVIHWWWFTLR